MKLKQNVAISESGFVFDSANGESYNVNPIGKEILSLLKQNLTKDQIQDMILTRYDVDLLTFEQNYYDFLSILQQYNLIELED